MKILSTFLVTMTFFLLVYGGATFLANRKSPEWKKKICLLHKQIDELNQLKKGYLLRALTHQNQADRLQFQQDELLTAKRHSILAEENRKIVQRLEEDILELESDKEKILKENKFFR